MHISVKYVYTLGLEQILILGKYSVRSWYSDYMIKLVLEYSLKSCDPTHMMHLSSGSDTLKAVVLNSIIYIFSFWQEH